MLIYAEICLENKAIYSSTYCLVCQINSLILMKA